MPDTKAVPLLHEFVFDTTNEEGRLVNTTTGDCIAVDPIGTILLEALLEYPTGAALFTYLHTRIEASDDELTQGLQAMLQGLEALGIGIASIEKRPSSASSTSHLLQDTQNNSPVPAPAPREYASELQQPHGFPQAQEMDWEIFLTGRWKNSPLPRLSLRQRGLALMQAVGILLLIGSARFQAFLFAQFHQMKRVEQIQQREWFAIRQYLSKIRRLPLSTYEMLDEETLMRIARRELVVCQLIVRLFSPAALCLVRSVALCAYLRSLGFPAQVVIGRSLYGQSDALDFHAWVELTGWVVNDYAELPSGYAVLQRIPSHEEMDTSARLLGIPGLPVLSALLSAVLLLLVGAGTYRMAKTFLRKEG